MGANYGRELWSMTCGERLLTLVSSTSLLLSTGDYESFDFIGRYR